MRVNPSLLSTNRAVTGSHLLAQVAMKLNPSFHAIHGVANRAVW